MKFQVMLKQLELNIFIQLSVNDQMQAKLCKDVKL